jgi:hypothetical protein
MIRAIEGLAENVIGVEAVGEVKAEDYEFNAAPRVRSRFQPPG